MVEFEIVARGFYRPGQVSMEYDPELRMPVTPQIQAWMDAHWQEKLQQAREMGSRLFEAPLFRFIEATSRDDGTLHVLVGDTTYKEYVTTRVPEFSAGRARQELGNALSVCSVVETCDDYILLDRRQGVDVYVGRYHVIGGFFERNIDVTAHSASPDPFGAIRREIREETGVQADDISEQHCLGVVYDTQVPHGEMCFLTRLNIAHDEVLHHRTPEEDEIKELLTLHVTPESLRAFIVHNHGNISATGEPNLLLYGAWKFGKAWFEDIMTSIC
ncbi:MAG TPA: NUDIX hydrolase [Ktedonosporobacter sp.]|jgi:8-oxo-dGTP pyrophosphatase MutT (NUDIX family)|nr:NUDIX hydrolase [Ktedonosporobacter sp.]